MFVFFYILFFFVNTDIVTSKHAETDFLNNDMVPRVVNGFAAKLGDVPYQIGFKIELPRRKICVTFCGGVIISPTKLLSAAHCFAKDPNFCQKLCSKRASKLPLTRVYAVAGYLRNRGVYETNSTDGQWRTIKSVTYPKSYKFPKNDIAILYTFTPFQFNNHVSSIPIAKKYIDYRGQCLVSGYGLISKKESSSKLLLAHLDLMPNYKCSTKFRKNMRKFVCTETLVTNVGKGDSGGPLVCSNTGDPNEGSNGVLVGIVSGNQRRAGTFFTRVSYFSRYIGRNKSCSLQPIIILYAFLLL